MPMENAAIYALFKPIFWVLSVFVLSFMKYVTPWRLKAFYTYLI
jgi:hypothetical protein